MSSTFHPDARNVNALWSSVFVETLVCAGVTRAIISPGSRSTPLAMAFARRAEFIATPALDERSAAFFALGLAKAKLQPVVLLCTSGTAGANYFPAVIEAYESGVPLLVITADRPPELRACASGQTIDQQKLFGSHVQFYHELAVPGLDAGLFRYLRQTVQHAVARTQRPQPGPVHLNAPFRDPLPPVPDDGSAHAFASGIDWSRFFNDVTAPVLPLAVAALPQWPSDCHGLIVVGPNQPPDADAFTAAVGEIARRLGWPVLADGLSPLRSRASSVANLITTYDAILRHAPAAERLAPDTVLAIGGWPTSKILRGWLETQDATTWLLSERVDNRDALHTRGRVLPMSVAALARALPEQAASSGYAGMWRRSEERVRAALDRRLAGQTTLVEPCVAWLLAQHAPAGTPVFVSNSMPIRDVEYVWPANDRAFTIWCNRGANGIDGTLSTALGVAEALGRPTVLLTGDLALLHDSNGFLLRPQFRGSLTVVLIDNHGGGIFEHLPVAQFDPPFETFFATPQPAEFRALCAAHGIEYVAIAGAETLVSALQNLPAAGVRVLHVRTDRKGDAALRKRLFTDIAAE